MPNLRIIHNNAADRATLTASSSVGALVPANLKNDLKSVVWRSATVAVGATPVARLDASWPAAEMIGGVALVYCRLTSQALMRVRGTNEAPATNLLPNSEGAASTLSTRTNGVTDAPAIANFATALQFASAITAGGDRAYRLANLGTSTAATLSIFVQMDDGAPPAPGIDFSIVLFGTVVGAANVLDLGGGLYRVFANATGGGSAQSFGVSRTQGQSARGMRVTGFQLEAGDQATSYFRTGSVAATRPLGYMDDWQSYGLDSGWINPCPASDVTPATMGANGYAYGEGVHARAWLAAQAQVRFLRIEITDSGNPGGYIEVSRLVCGSYWEPAHNPDYGASVQPVDSSTNFRNGAGDLMSDVGTRSDKLSLSMSWLDPVDRPALLRILRGNGITRPVFVSLFPNHGDPMLEQDHQLFGKLVETPAMSLPSYNIAAATLQIESI